MSKQIVGFTTNSDVAVRLTYKGDDIRDIKRLSKNCFLSIGTYKKTEEYLVYDMNNIKQTKCKTAYRIRIRHNSIDYHILCGASQKFIVSTDMMESNDKLAHGWVCPAIHMIDFDFENYKYYINSSIPEIKYEIIGAERKILPTATKLYNIDTIAHGKPTYNIILESRDENISILTINNERYKGSIR